MASHSAPASSTPLFTSLIDLASQRLGGRVLAVSDEFFAEASNMLKPAKAVFDPEAYTDRGKEMDGWESRRKRMDGSWLSQEDWERIPADWCILKLGVSGVVRGLDIDTSFFLGNHAPSATVEGLCADDAAADEDFTLDKWADKWTTILTKNKLERGSSNFFEVHHEARLTHIRLQIFPDGGVARFRVYGDVVPNWSAVGPKSSVANLAAVENGGLVITATDMFFSGGNNIIMPGRGWRMSDGWETKRRRGPGYDSIFIRLGAPGKVRSLLVDTCHFKGNFPYACSVDVCHVEVPESAVQAGGHVRVQAEKDIFQGSSVEWLPLLPQSRLTAHAEHTFDIDSQSPGASILATHVRLSIYPDGGVSRLRVFATQE